MSKAGGKARVIKKVLQKVEHVSKLQVYIPAGMASPKPPLGSQLGQRNINVANFCNDFNKRTADIKEGIPVPCRVKVKGDGTYDLVIHKPPTTYFLMQAAGIEKGTLFKGDVSGKVTFKHIYEIASIKAEDPPNALLSLEQICQMLVGIARSCGIKVVKSLDLEEFKEFRTQREEAVAKFQEEQELAKEAKMLRTG